LKIKNNKISNIMNLKENKLIPRVIIFIFSKLNVSKNE